MTVYTYVDELPSQRVIDGLRVGLRTKRSILMPPTLKNNPHFVDLIDSIDEAFDQHELQAQALFEIRNPFALTVEGEQKVSNGCMVDNRDFLVTDVINRQVEFLGVSAETVEHIHADALQVMFQNLGSYWVTKDMQGSVEFINYCLGTDIEVCQLWGDGKNSYEESGPGRHLTNTVLVKNPASAGLELFSKLFQEVCSYTLVLKHG